MSVLGDSKRSSPPVDKPKTQPVEIVVISLPTAIERRRKIHAMFDGSGLQWSFFDAHTSLQFPGLRYDREEVCQTFGRTLSAPEIAVCSSHVAVLDAFLKRRAAPYILVLEDDAIFDVDFPLNAFAEFCAGNGIEYVRLFGKHYAKAVHLGFFYDRSIIRYRTSPAGAQAYIMSVAAAQTFLASFRSITATVDLAVDEFWTTGLPIYSIFPYPVIERFSATSIPIPGSRDILSAETKRAWRRTRVTKKAQKIFGNLRLAKIDRNFREKYLEFRQISGHQEK